MPVTDDVLYKLLLENQFIAEDKLKEASEKASKSKTTLYEILIGDDTISDENLGNLISDYLKVPFVTLSKVSIPLPVLKIIPGDLAAKKRVISFEQDKDALKIATSNPSQPEFLELVSKKAGQEIKLYYATDRDIEDTLRLYKTELQQSFNNLMQTEVEEASKIGGDAPITKIVDSLIDSAYDMKASDIHIEPNETESLVRFRIDGILHDQLKLPKNLHDQVVTRIKVSSKLRTDEHLSAQDGKMQIKLPSEDLDIRVSIVPIVEGEKVVLRLLTSHFRQFGLADLGMGEKDLEKVKTAFSKPYGMILSTGPTGSGKTTSMYAILKILNTREKNIATIEDPVEYDIEGLNQIQVNPKTNLTFAEGLRSILRQDPDIIYVGEIRDEETADIAINSATTGHLVLSTLHTNDAATTLPRLLDMGIEPFLVSSTVNVIVGQRLVRKICERCKYSLELKVQKAAPPKVATKTPKVSPKTLPAAKPEDNNQTQQETLLNSLPVEMLQKHLGTSDVIRVYHGKGCNVCHLTGYVGRIGIFEVLEVSPGIQELINQKADSEVITQKAKAEGMNTMMEDGLDKVQQGITTIEEVLRATTIE